MDKKPFVNDLPTRKDAILDWCEKHNPGMKAPMEQLLTNHPNKDLVEIVTAIAFASGRHFQNDNPHVDVYQGV